MQRLMIAAPTQLRWAWDDRVVHARFDELPEETQATVLALLARLIARGVLSGEEDTGG